MRRSSVSRRRLPACAFSNSGRELRWYDASVIAVVTNGDEGHDIRHGDVLMLVGPETVEIVAVVMFVNEG